MGFMVLTRDRQLQGLTIGGLCVLFLAYHSKFPRWPMMARLASPRTCKTRSMALASSPPKPATDQAAIESSWGVDNGCRKNWGWWKPVELLGHRSWWVCFFVWIHVFNEFEEGKAYRKPMGVYPQMQGCNQQMFPSTHWKWYCMVRGNKHWKEKTVEE